jgi:5-methylcytosine-specific restriction endonuclease McrA
VGFKIEILAASGRECPYCGVVMRITRPRPTKREYFPTQDHIIPKSRLPGQPKTICCLKCNRDKSNMLLDEWLAVLRVRQDARAARVAAFMDRNFDLVRRAPKSAPAEPV